MKQDILHRALDRGRELINAKLLEGMEKADDGTLDMTAYAALLKKAEELTIQIQRLETYYPRRENE